MRFLRQYIGVSVTERTNMALMIYFRAGPCLLPNTSDTNFFTSWTSCLGEVLWAFSALLNSATFWVTAVQYAMAALYPTKHLNNFVIVRLSALSWCWFLGIVHTFCWPTPHTVYALFGKPSKQHIKQWLGILWQNHRTPFRQAVAL